jgi:hypothetical protein
MPRSGRRSAGESTTAPSSVLAIAKLCPRGCSGSPASISNRIEPSE